ncbi:uncharacterized protein [Antedon mediterranea]|uniref:uncharacterized protein n=1 Tax=Antedon mediterranea TaxID=105859 RepID=UPI003AF8374B
MKDQLAKQLYRRSRSGQFTQADRIQYNAIVHETTGYSPFYLVHGREPILACNVLYETNPSPNQTTQEYVADLLNRNHKASDFVTEKVAIQKNKQKSFYDRKQSQPHKIGEKVWLDDPVRWKGPYAVVEVKKFSVQIARQ